MPFINWTVFTDASLISRLGLLCLFLANVVLCYANTHEMSNNVNGCLLILI